MCQEIQAGGSFVTRNWPELTSHSRQVEFLEDTKDFRVYSEEKLSPALVSVIHTVAGLHSCAGLQHYPRGARSPSTEAHGGGFAKSADDAISSFAGTGGATAATLRWWIRRPLNCTVKRKRFKTTLRTFHAL